MHQPPATEFFRYLAFEWDIVAARTLIGSRPVIDHLAITDEGCANLFGRDLAPDEVGKYLSYGTVSINRERALSDAIDTSIPIIGIIMRLHDGDETFLVIDGHHRIYKAWKTGLSHLPIHVLSPDEELSIRTWRSFKPQQLVTA